ncbi:hypothetical protein [Pseudomonas versuta]|uniref:hypothetical protein n=1 Tax=Pseudomonas versuta TaxID=1788301 RepID=UPI0015C56EC6|nr:hypothetical protein [Pseudomonas versuta]
MNSTDPEAIVGAGLPAIQTTRYSRNTAPLPSPASWLPQLSGSRLLQQQKSPGIGVPGLFYFATRYQVIWIMVCMMLLWVEVLMTRVQERVEFNRP